MRRYTVTVDGTPFTLDVQETAADRFTVTVGGHAFEATLEAAEDLPGSDITPEMPVVAPAGLPATPAATSSPGAPRVTHAAAPAGRSRGPAAEPAAARTSVVAAPMPGVVLEVRVAAGDAVRRGDALLVLEAMKMRNTIRAPRDATVVEVSVEAGRPVAPGEPLVRFAEPSR